MAVYPFLSFNGNCREAMSFYQSCFGGELKLKSLSDSPQGERIPEYMKELILHASLVSEHVHLFASDLGGEDGLFAGNRISLLFNTSHSQELMAAFKNLSKDADITNPVSNNTLNGEWATLTDKYFVQWIFSIDKK